jgi:conflict system pore-forming effector with SLATT domain
MSASTRPTGRARFSEVPDSSYDNMDNYNDKNNTSVGGNPYDNRPHSLDSSSGSFQRQRTSADLHHSDQYGNSQTPSHQNTSEKSKPTLNLDTPLSLPDFRMLLGMSPEQGAKYDNPPAGTRYPHYLPRWLRAWSKAEDPEAPTSIYYNLVGEEKYTIFKYRLYDSLVYGGLITQLVLSAVLIVLGALPSSHHISIAILGAVNGVVTGILSLIKGQGLPVRLIKYAESLRGLREDIEWNERQLRAKLSTVTYRTVFRLRDNYQKVRLDEMANHPDIWQTSGAAAKSGTSPRGAQGVPAAIPVPSSKPSGTNAEHGLRGISV